MSTIKTYFLLPASTLLLFMALPASAFAQRSSDSTRFKQTVQLREVVVRGSQVSRINNSAFNAVAVDASKLRNTNLDLAHLLDRVPGIKIREDGGMGSAATINLNGFTGKHVKLFVDGVPMDGTSAGFDISNISVSMLQRVEVYKGVVPVEFGGDALGGAINIVTDSRGGTYADASYSLASFNTHRANIAAGHTFKNGFTVKLNAYANYSDNNYRVRVRNTNLQTMQMSEEEEWFRRFHDTYRNQTAIMQVGVIGKRWADRLMLGVNYNREYAQIQNANLMSIVFGGKHRRAEGLSPNIVYEKREIIPHLDVRLSARYTLAVTHNVDTLSRTYNWRGEWIANAYRGEGQAVLAEFKGKTLSLTATAIYRLNKSHSITLSNTLINYHRRTTNNEANAVQQTAATFMRRVNNKNIVGLSYKLAPTERWNVLLFAKYYEANVRGPVRLNHRDYEEQSRKVSTPGYGAAGTYSFNDDWQIKFSYEKTCRLPTDRELFGDGDYEQGESRLMPERSNNMNLNLSFQHTFGKAHTLQLDAALNSRRIQDYIIRTISSTGVAVSSNHGRVTSYGADLSAHYYYKDKLTVGGSFSVQNMRDRERLTVNSAPSATYGNRVPNLPYSFADIDAGYKIKNIIGSRNLLAINYNMRYVHRFFRSWSGAGSRLYIPTQTSHNAALTLSLGEGRYNISLSADNITNALLYDNYSLQKPGRSFGIKLRYVFYSNR